MLSRLLAAGVAVSLFVAGALASGSGTLPAPPENPYASHYAKNVTGMQMPDQSLDRVMPADADTGFSSFAEPSTQSKTCSQRCSTTCTTTRGCKRQTDGCGGTVTPSAPRTSPTTPLAQEAAALPPVVRYSTDLTAHTLINAQRALAIAGYEGLCLDGSYSPTFTAALKDFQTRNSVVATGVLTDPIWQVLDTLLRR